MNEFKILSPEALKFNYSDVWLNTNNLHAIIPFFGINTGIDNNYAFYNDNVDITINLLLVCILDKIFYDT